ncbi:putative DNA-binding transcriptional regulator YafY [Kribbella orskensis]|uniref:DNA-binding transcriptional regulator YafY n=1 Tax=Kribbella orskensis TaxID=2512216 RepID=A0ABY2B9S5_9ACTN|nr:MULTISPECIES: WYL domain-containing protein [Kribbella]TCN30496.1 putative DNA-binding transcriptional regulator YafY [Kribbella sp. VKM Ac-2500]TCO11138.1 putative DNA-binding transcriptional regulator YafY [Kribbella orskensis]
MRSSRLLSILLLLQTRRQLTARELATELEVSLRTIYRDVEALAAAGVPVYADQGRAGGYRLVDGYRTKLTGLTEGEAAALFMVGMPGPAAALGLTEQTSAAELKLLAALGPDQRDRAGRLKNRFHLDMPAWYREAEDSPHLAAIAAAVLHDRRIKVLYRRWEAPREVERILEPYGLVLKNGTWYVVAATPGGLRTYRVSNILELTPTDEEFTRPDGFDLGRHWQDHLDQFEQRRFTSEAVVRISAPLVARLSDLSSTLLLKAIADAGAEPDEDGSITVAVPIEAIGNAATQLVRYGDRLEVLDPPELRAELSRLARSLVALYES